MQVQRGKKNTIGDELVCDQRVDLNTLSFRTQARVLIRDLGGVDSGGGGPRKKRGSPGDGMAPDKSKSL